jgi:hypothetical protein
MAFESSGEIASLELRLIPRFNLIAQTRRRTFSVTSEYESTKHSAQAAALHQLPPKVEMILLKKGYSGSLPLCFRLLANLEMLCL